MRVNFISVVACCLLAGGTARADETFNSIDLDHDGRIDEQEAQAAGRAVFQSLDANRDGNLDVPEIRQCPIRLDAGAFGLTPGRAVVVEMRRHFWLRA